LTNIWVEVTPEQLERKVAELHDGGENCVRRTDYTAIATHAMILASDPHFFTDAPVGMACPTGFYLVLHNEILCEPLSPDHRQRVMLNIDPVKMATPMFDRFLQETFQSNRDGEEQQQRNLLQEVFGTTMLGTMAKYQKAVFDFDPYGRAGKGTKTEILSALVPKEFVTSNSPFRWDQEYYLASLAGKRLNAVGELPDGVAIPAAAFKTVTGGDLLTGRNPAGRPFSFKNQAAHIFMSNHLITTRDHSEAFYTRWILIEFPNSRLRNPKPLDLDLAKNIIAEELSGIAFWALQGAQRVLANGKFSPSMAHDRLMQEWRRSTSSLEEFIHESCDIGDPTFTFLRSKLYESYVLWCKDSGRKPYAKSNVKNLLEHNSKLGITLVRINGGYETFKGVRLKPESKTFPDLDDNEY
jgi:P4 family phage/plasmid primase-like protien